MLLNKIDDPRDNLARARRRELVDFANANGMPHINENMDAGDIRDQLRARGLTNIKVPNRQLGKVGRTVIHGSRVLTRQPSPPPAAKGDTVTLTQGQLADIIKSAVATALQQKPARPAKPKRFTRLVERPKSEINILRDKCKELGIHMDRRDKTEDLKRKIAEHGQNAA